MQPTLEERREWAKKLKDSGFKDLESFAVKPSDQFGYQLNSNRIRGEHGPAKALASAAYFRSAGIYAHHGLFESESEQAIFESYANGLTYREMASIHKVGLASAHRLVEKLKAQFHAALLGADPMFADDDVEQVSIVEGGCK